METMAIAKFRNNKMMNIMNTLHKYAHELNTASFGKFLAIFLCSSVLTIAEDLFEKYIYSDWEFGAFLIILISLDTLCGVIRAIKQHDFSSRRLGEDLTIKIILYCIALIVIHVLTNFTVNGTHPIFIIYIDSLTMSAFLLRESISIFENIAVIKPNLFPTWIVKRLKMFDDEGNPISPTVHSNPEKESK